MATAKNTIKKTATEEAIASAAVVSAVKVNAVKDTVTKDTPLNDTPLKTPRKKPAVTVNTVVATAATSTASHSAVGSTAGLFGIQPYHISTNEEYMSANMLDHFAKVLKAWKKELMEEVDRTVTHMQDESVSMADINDRATQEEEFAIELRARDRERRLLRKIDASLRYIDDGDYGYCETCGVEIGLRRLEARPTATLCIDCKSLAEIKEKQDKGA